MRRVFSTAGRPVCWAAVSRPARELTAANFGTGMPSETNICFSLSRSWPEVSARGAGNSGTRAATNSAACCGTFSNSKVASSMPAQNFARASWSR